MQKSLIAVAGFLFFANLALAQTPAASGTVAAAAPAAGSCEMKAVDKNGKPLAGAAKNAFMKKCQSSEKTTACAAKAVDKNGKALAGAAKSAFMKKCEAAS